MNAYAARLRTTMAKESATKNEYHTIIDKIKEACDAGVQSVVINIPSTFNAHRLLEDGYEISGVTTSVCTIYW